jgi:hypothetical protein
MSEPIDTTTVAEKGEGMPSSEVRRKRFATKSKNFGKIASAENILKVPAEISSVFFLIIFADFA